jgi:hypothetical protein
MVNKAGKGTVSMLPKHECLSVNRLGEPVKRLAVGYTWAEVAPAS